jgi:dolichyl-diphosphooligosaccharide--protein glycosyltransferase
MDRQDWFSLADRFGPAAALALAVGFMAWIRTLGSDNVFVDGSVYFTAGNDPWYHARIVNLIVEHFPATQRFDVWSQFPYGTGRHSGFGGLFDQLVALVALILGGGSPSPELVDAVIAYAPVAFGALTAVPAYMAGKWATNKWGGVLTAIILSLLGGGFLSRTLIGVADHQSSEAFFGTLAFAGFIYAMRTAYAEKPTVADIRDRNWVVLRRPVVASFLGGVAIASYMMTWPPGVAFVFTIGVFVLLQMVRDHLNGRPTEYLAITTAATMLPAGLLTLGYAKEYDLSATGFSLLQPLVVFGIGGGAVLLYGIAMYVRREGYARRYYPVAVGGIIAAVLVVSFLLFPRTANLFESLFTRMYSFGTATSQTAGTVAEIQPADLDTAWRAFGPVFYLAAYGFAVLLARVISRNRPTELLLVLWSFSAVSAYFTMVRFGYYVAVNVALLSAFAIWWTGSSALELGEIEALRDVETYQILGVALLLVLVLPGNVVAWDNNQPNWESNVALNTRADIDWQEELAWMQDNTPDVNLTYNDLTSPPDGGDFDYPKDAYGVMSWWDYGHWITKTAERIPNANPFQEGPRPASAYLLAQTEERANLILDALPSMKDSASDIDGMSNEELRAIIANQSEQEASEDTRYVMIDDQMAALQGLSRQSSGKFGPITRWTGPDFRTYTANQNQSLRTIRAGGFSSLNTTARLPSVSQRYENTMLSRLYFQDAQALEQYRLVHETNGSTTFLGLAQSTRGSYRNLGVNAMLTGRIVRLLQQRRDIVAYDLRQESRVKTFERVEGAQLTGQVEDADENTTVLARLPLQTNTGRNFTYSTRVTADTNGSFSVTVPYPTNNAVGPDEGGTASGVTARGNYSVVVASQIQTFRGQLLPLGQLASGSVTVPESAIYDGDEIAADLNETVRYQPGSLNATLEENVIANGSTTNLTVTAGFTNDTTRTVTDAATFESTDPSVATVDNGTVTANQTGTALINASFRGETASSFLIVESESTYESGSLDATLQDDQIANDSTTNLTVAAGFTNGTTRVVTGAADLSSNETSVATVADDGTVTANETGTALISATYQGDTASVVLTVTNASADGNTGSVETHPLPRSNAVDTATVPPPAGPALADPDRVNP